MPETGVSNAKLQPIWVEEHRRLCDPKSLRIRRDIEHFSVSPLSPSSAATARPPLAPSATVMHGNQIRPPFSVRGVRGPAAGVARPPPPPPALILYAIAPIAPDVAAECERVASELRLARTEVKHLQAACMALKAHPRAMLLASTAIRSWDRQVIEEHAAGAGTPLRWVAPDDESDDVAAAVRAWATDTIRRARTMR